MMKRLPARGKVEREPISLSGENEDPRGLVPNVIGTS